MKDTDFGKPFCWFMTSLHPKHVDSVLFQHNFNLDVMSHHALHDAEGRVRTDGAFEVAQSWSQLGAMFDMYHPYWKHRKIFFRSRGSSAAFVSTCQLYVDAGYWSAAHCNSDSQRAYLTQRHASAACRPAKDPVVDVILSNILPRMRLQHEQFDKQQRVIDRLLETIQALNATVALLAGQQNVCFNTAESSRAAAG